MYPEELLSMYPEKLRTYLAHIQKNLELGMYPEELRTHSSMYPEEIRTYRMYPEELSMYSEELRTCSSSGCGYMQCMYASEYMHACMYPEELRTWHVSRRS